MNRALIIGCGYVGQALAKLYVNQGTEVWALQRHPVNLNNVKNILCDITLVNKNVLPDVDLIFYLVSPNSSSESSYFEVYDTGLNKLIALLREKQNTKLVFCSSTRVYGQCHGEEVDENSIAQPNDVQGKLLLNAEKSVLSLPNSVVVRFGGIYGPRRTKLLEELMNNKIMLSPTPVYTNRIHLSDCVGILYFLAKMNLNTIFLGVDCEPILYNDMLMWLASLLKAPNPKMGERPPQRLLNSNKRCFNHKIISYGYKFKYPTYRDGYRSILTHS